MTAPLRLAAGRVFAGDFKVVRPLRAGGQGSLYVVEQLSTGRQRALKLMLPELVAQPASRKRFELEAKIAARINSDHVVQSIASGVDADSGTPWLVMELLEGEDLAAYVQRKKRLMPGAVLEIFSQLCHALGEAHRQGIVHRDLKPENVFLANPRRRGVPFMVKILDFGIARILAEATLTSATTSGLGTPMWMAPEQAEPGQPIAPSTDVWPLGLLAFRMLTGHLFWKSPYDPGASVMMLMAEAFMHPIPAASERAEHYKCKERLPPGFDAWFAKCVARKMEDRYPDAAEAFGALEPLLVAFGEETPEPSRQSRRGALPESFDRPTPDPVSGAAPGSVGAARTPAGSASGAPDATGPGRRTWEGAPELAADVVKSAEASGPVSFEPPSSEGDLAPPPSSGGEPSGPSDRGVSPTVEPVQATPLPAAPSRRRAVMAIAVVLSAAACVLAVAMTRGPRTSARASAGTPSAAPTAPAPSAVRVDSSAPSASVAAAPSASASVEVEAVTVPASATAEPAPSVEPSSVPHRTQHLCRHKGAKCFSNDDCCERVCRHWTCRENAALQDPYGSDDK